MKKYTVILIMLLISVFLTSCEDVNLDSMAQSLVGKTKSEVIALSFRDSARVLGGKVQICVATYRPKANTYQYHNYYYQTEEEALLAKALRESNSWEVFWTRNESSWPASYNYIRLTFENGKVKSFTIGKSSDF